MKAWKIKVSICIGILMSIFCTISFAGSCFAGEVVDVENTDTIPPAVVTELDLGDYQSEMIVGEKQLLSVTILPMEATEQILSYVSSEPSVATINGMGRITALAVGNTRITVSCGDVSAGFTLTVRETENTEISVTELDLGECPKEITVGTSQVLMVYTIPADATNQVFKYKSDNKKVASVNELGRLTGNSVGTANITVSCGKVKRMFTVEVVEEEKERDIQVTDIEISDYEDELKVDSTLTLTTTVLPADATDATVHYKSSDMNIATVNSSGEVKGIAPGTVVITVSAGTIVKQITITVKIGTTGIKLNNEYLVLKPEETYQLKATVQPEGAAGQITYQSSEPHIATVSSKGFVTAKECGNTAIIVSNGDLQVSVSVIVNEEGKVQNNQTSVSYNSAKISGGFPDNVNTLDYPVISSEMLKYFYETGKCLTVHGEGYTIYIDGKKIVNYGNELHTMLDFEDGQGGISFLLNEGEKLCGSLTIDLNSRVKNERYLYLYHEEKKRYQRLETEDISLLELSTAGRYLLSEKKLSGMKVNLVILFASAFALLISIAAYIFMKKRYWFW